MWRKASFPLAFLMLQYKLGKLGTRNEAWSEITLIPSDIYAWSLMLDKCDDRSWNKPHSKHLLSFLWWQMSHSLWNKDNDFESNFIPNTFFSFNKKGFTEKRNPKGHTYIDNNIARVFERHALSLSLCRLHLMCVSLSQGSRERAD